MVKDLSFAAACLDDMFGLAQTNQHAHTHKYAHTDSTYRLTKTETDKVPVPPYHTIRTVQGPKLRSADTHHAAAAL